MSFLPQPDPVVLAFFFFKKFVYLEVLAVLCLARVCVGAGVARWPALAAFVLALGGVLTVFAPAMGVTGGVVYASAAQVMAGGSGMAALLVPSVLFAMSSLSPQRRWRVLDLLHGVLLAGLLGLWWWTS